jgi:hypothetical protein
MTSWRIRIFYMESYFICGGVFNAEVTEVSCQVV